jgi:hypothetical protein
LKASIEITDIKREWKLLKSNMTLLTLQATSKLMQLPGLEKLRPSLNMPKPGQRKLKIQIVNDFINEEKLEKLKNDNKEEKKNLLKLNEEINLLYVAITRTKNSIHIPEVLMPTDFPHSPQIHILKEETSKSKKAFNALSTEKTYLADIIREQHKDTYQRWTVEMDDELTVMYCEGVNIKDMAKHFGRSRGEINARIRKLELVELYG